MRLRNIKNKDNILSKSKYLIKDIYEYKGKYKELFNNNNPIMLEIGMGKGKFIIENAILNKNNNYIGIERADSILAKAIKKIENNDVNNLRLIKCDADDLVNIFSNEIDTIYLNFSDPWPKNRHEKRRLTSKQFLDIYSSIFKDNNKIILKTDNRAFFEYSIVSLSQYGYKISNITFDLHNTDETYITTEYEDKFANEGKPIYKLECLKM